LRAAAATALGPATSGGENKQPNLEHNTWWLAALEANPCLSVVGLLADTVPLHCVGEVCARLTQCSPGLTAGIRLVVGSGGTDPFLMLQVAGLLPQLNGGHYVDRVVQVGESDTPWETILDRAKFSLTVCIIFDHRIITCDGNPPPPPHTHTRVF
jgi:hypothetical protein